MSSIPFKRRLIASSVGTIILGLTSGLAYAQSKAGDASAEALEEITVTGFRSSLMLGQDLKRNAVGSQESIMAEDIADFPDLNLAESLQRIPGVTINRDNGEGRQIALRGLGADFTRTQLNGMEALATNASILDSRGSVSRTRSFDFNIFASELFNRIDVYKSSEAKLDEGGIAGTVNLRTPKPFDYDGFKGALSGKLSYAENSEETNPRIAALVSNTWGDFGATLSVAHSQSDSVEFGHRNWQWEGFSTDSFGPNISAADQAKLSDGSLAYPVANTISSVSNTQERTGITLALQWQASEKLLLSTDIIYGKLESEAREYNAATRGYGQINDFEVRGSSIVYAEFLDADIRNESKFNQSETEFSQYIFEADATLTDSLSAKFTVGYSKSEFDAPVHDKVYTVAANRQFSFDYRDGPAGNNTYDFDITDPNAYQLHRADTREDYISNEFSTFKADFEYEINDFSSLDFGLQYKNYESGGYERRQTIRNLENLGISYTSGPFSTASTQNFAVADVQASFPSILAAGLNARNTDRLFTRDLTAADNIEGSAYTVEEETAAIYTQYNIEVENVRANFGVRYVTTDVVSAGDLLVREDGQAARFEPVSIGSSYSEILPSFNFTVDLSEEMLFRFSANRNLSRPSLGDLRASANIGFAGGTIARGNPELKPFIADSFEASIEYYFGEINYLSLGVFSKDMASFVVTESSNVPYAETGLPANLLPPGDEGRIFVISKPVNGNGATLTGAELAGQYEFGGGFGVIANITYAQSDSEHFINGEKVNADLLGLSKISYNLTAFYEAENWGARISQAYRDGYLESVAGRVNDFQGVEETAFVDASVFYNVSENMKLSLEAINLTNEKLYRYQDVADHRSTTVYESGSSFLLGLNYKF